MVQGMSLHLNQTEPNPTVDTRCGLSIALPNDHCNESMNNVDVTASQKTSALMIMFFPVALSSQTVHGPDV